MFSNPNFPNKKSQLPIKITILRVYCCRLAAELNKIDIVSGSMSEVRWSLGLLRKEWRICTECLVSNQFRVWFKLEMSLPAIFWQGKNLNHFIGHGQMPQRLASLSLILFFLSSFFQGCGKSILAKQFANSLGYNVEPVMLYQVGHYVSCY